MCDDIEIAGRATELERARERLHASEELYRHVVELSSLNPWTADKDGNIIGVDERWREWTGAEPESAMDGDWVRFAHPDEAEALLAAWVHAVRTGRRFEAEWRVRGADGTYRWCHARAAKRTDEGAGDIVWYGTLEDIHERHTAAEAFQRTQAELAHVSRLSAMGAMASAIAHDINQPLTAIANYVRGCKRLLDHVEGSGKADLASGLEDADRNAVRASGIVRRVRDFVSRGTVEAEPTDLTALVEEACRFALVDAAALGISHRLEVDANCLVMADRIQIQQVLVNLIRNAVEALEGQPRRDIVLRIGAGETGFCTVSVCDTGCGIAADAGSKIFDPFYTTRKDGMGVGLSISRMIVEAHGGRIWHTTGASRETIIRFTLPVVSTQSIAQAPEAGA